MNHPRVSITSLTAALLLAACSGSPSSSGGSGGSGAVTAGGSTAGPSGGSQAGPAGGSTTGPTGAGGSTGAGGGTTGPTGSGGNTGAGGNTAAGGTASAGGSTGAGGSAIGPGGAGGNATTTTSNIGGSTVGGSTTGAGGKAAGGAGGSATGGASGSPAGGAGGKATTASGGAPTGGTSSTTTAVTEPKLITSAQNAFWKTDGTLTEVTSGTADVTVNDTSTAQNWDGFGGTFNEAGWIVLSQLNAADRDQAIKLLFDAEAGARFAFGRVPIGASDYARDRYTLNETANDYTMTNFSIERDRKDLIPYIKAALAIKSDVRLWASPWTPPTWMKDNGAMDGGNMKDDAQILKAHALYLAKFVEEYGKENLKIEAIHPQNEPGYETRYPSCLWTAALFNKFVRDYLGPTFAERNVTAQIFLGTMSNADAGKDGTIISTVTGDSATMKFIKGFGLQWNMIDSVGSLKSRSLPIIQTEHKCGNYPWNPSGYPAFNPDKAPNDYPYAVESWGLIRDWIKAGITSYSAWNMVLDTIGKNLDPQRPWPQNALLTVDTGAKKLVITPTYYVFRHVSQYVDPGAKVVGTSGGDALAFKNPDNTIVAIVYNSGTAKKSIVTIAGKKLQFDMPSNGWATINWK